MVMRVCQPAGCPARPASAPIAHPEPAALRPARASTASAALGACAPMLSSLPPTNPAPGGFGPPVASGARTARPMTAAADPQPAPTHTASPAGRADGVDSARAARPPHPAEPHTPPDSIPSLSALAAGGGRPGAHAAAGQGAAPALAGGSGEGPQPAEAGALAGSQASEQARQPLAGGEQSGSIAQAAHMVDVRRSDGASWSLENLRLDPANGLGPASGELQLTIGRERLVTATPLRWALRPISVCAWATMRPLTL